MKLCPNHSTKVTRKTRRLFPAKAILFVALVICAALSLSACDSTTKEKTEDHISTDIQAQDSYFSDYNLKIGSFSISKRQTNTDDKNDFVWCQATATNSDFSYSAEYKVTYVLYNEGWMLESCSKESSSIKPLHSPTSEDAMDVIYERCSDRIPDIKDIVTLYAANVSESGIDVNYPYLIPARPVYDDRGNFITDGWPETRAVFYHFEPQSGWTWEDHSVNFQSK